MHAIWFSFIVPTLVAAVWIWPKLRIPKLWFGLCLATLIGTTIWLGSDLYGFVGDGGGAVDLPRRLLYVILSETGKPVLPLALGSCLAGLFCWNRSKQDNAPTAENAEAETASGAASTIEN